MRSVFFIPLRASMSYNLKYLMAMSSLSSPLVMRGASEEAPSFGQLLLDAWLVAWVRQRHGHSVFFPLALLAQIEISDWQHSATPAALLGLHVVWPYLKGISSGAKSFTGASGACIKGLGALAASCAALSASVRVSRSSSHLSGKFPGDGVGARDGSGEVGGAAHLAGVLAPLRGVELVADDEAHPLADELLLASVDVLVGEPVVPPFGPPPQP